MDMSPEEYCLSLIKLSPARATRPQTHEPRNVTHPKILDAFLCRRVLNGCSDNVFNLVHQALANPNSDLPVEKTEQTA